MMMSEAAERKTDTSGSLIHIVKRMSAKSFSATFRVSVLYRAARAAPSGHLVGMATDVLRTRLTHPTNWTRLA